MTTQRVLGSLWLAVVLCAVTTSALQAGEGWVSPTSFDDPENLWADKPNAGDGNTATFASDTSNRGGDGAWLYLILPQAINSSRLRVMSDFGYGIVDSVQIDVEKDGNWETVHNGAIDDVSYTEITLPPVR